MIPTLGKTCLAELLKTEGMTDVYVCGIAADVCVGELEIVNTFCIIRKIRQYFTANTERMTGCYFSASTAFHAMELGFRTMVIEDCSRGIDENSIKAAYEKVRRRWGLIVHSSEVEKIITFLAMIWCS